MPSGESHIDLHTQVRPAPEKFTGSSGTTVVIAYRGPIMNCISLVFGIDLFPARCLNLVSVSMTSFMVTKQGLQVGFIDGLGAWVIPPESI